tara:strand:+ start:400 stop:609 length:210 start_codon:yes stop_codon:yes gene_type:complete
MYARVHFRALAAYRGALNALRDRRGATAMEYGLIGAGIALTLVVATFALGDEIVGLFGDIQSSFASKRS